MVNGSRGRRSRRGRGRRRSLVGWIKI